MTLEERKQKVAELMAYPLELWRHRDAPVLLSDAVTKGTWPETQTAFRPNTFLMIARLPDGRGISLDTFEEWKPDSERWRVVVCS